MQLTYETQEAVPEDLKESFVEFKDGDKSSWIHKDLAEAKKEAYRYKGDLTDLQKKHGSLSDTVDKLQEAERLREEEKQRLEREEKEKGGRHAEIIEDLEQKLANTESTWAEKYSGLQQEIRNKEKLAVVERIAGSKGTDKTRKELKRLVGYDLDFDDEGKLIVLNDEGKATSMTVEQYEASLIDRYPSLVGESHGKGGKANGGASGSGGITKKPSEMTTAERLEFKERDPVGFRQAFNL